ncbi:MAG: hypothetical protein QOH80_829 [Actinomycetota bacterium]|nr:hypothetical protein [Actinomycetota bacterium]
MTIQTAQLPGQRRPRNGSATATAGIAPARSIGRASLVAGVGLLLMSALAAFGKVVVLDGLVTPGDAAQTAKDIGANEGLFRLGIASLVLVIALDLVVAWSLYRVLRPVSARLSMIAAALRTVYAGVFLIALGPLWAEHTTTFDDIWHAGLFLFGLHLILIGYLASRSRYVPRAIGVLLVVAGLGYGIDTVGRVLTTGTWTDVSSFTFIGEFLLALWLVIRGRRLSSI